MASVSDDSVAIGRNCLTVLTIIEAGETENVSNSGEDLGAELSGSLTSGHDGCEYNDDTNGRAGCVISQPLAACLVVRGSPGWRAAVPGRVQSEVE